MCSARAYRRDAAPCPLCRDHGDPSAPLPVMWGVPHFVLLGMPPAHGAAVDTVADEVDVDTGLSDAECCCAGLLDALHSASPSCL